MFWFRLCVFLSARALLPVHLLVREKNFGSSLFKPRFRAIRELFSLLPPLPFLIFFAGFFHPKPPSSQASRKMIPAFLIHASKKIALERHRIVARRRRAHLKVGDIHSLS